MKDFFVVYEGQAASLLRLQGGLQPAKKPFPSGRAPQKHSRFCGYPAEGLGAGTARVSEKGLDKPHSDEPHRLAKPANTPLALPNPFPRLRGKVPEGRKGD